MVAVDSTASPVRPKRRGQGARKRQKRRRRVRWKSAKLVKSGRVDLTPCVVCGSTRNLTIHHVEPIQPDRFVFLCRPCHVLAHKPVFRTMEVCVASGHFSIRPEAIVRRTDMPAPRPGMPPDRIGRRSAKLVKMGKVDLTPCLICGSQENLTIHHVEPIQPDRFVFLCRPCHVLAHKPVFRTMEVCVASGHFSIRPEALVRRTDMPALRPEMPPDALRRGMARVASGRLSIRPDAGLSKKEVSRG